MNKNEKILAGLTIVFIFVVFTPAIIAVYKSWKCGLDDAIKWNGRIEEIK